MIMTSEPKPLVEKKELKSLKGQLRKENRSRERAEAIELREHVSPEMARAMDLAQERGISAILTTLPLEKYGFAIRAKRDYRDLLRMRYRNSESEPYVFVWQNLHARPLTNL